MSTQGIGLYRLHMCLIWLVYSIELRPVLVPATLQHRPYCRPRRLTASCLIDTHKSQLMILLLAADCLIS